MIGLHGDPTRVPTQLRGKPDGVSCVCAEGKHSGVGSPGIKRGRRNPQNEVSVPSSCETATAFQLPFVAKFIILMNLTICTEHSDDSRPFFFFLFSRSTSAVFNLNSFESHCGFNPVISLQSGVENEAAATSWLWPLKHTEF